jgi:predicted dehydrogenase
MERRTFFLAGGAVLTAHAAACGQIRVGVIGSGGRGRLVTGLFRRDPAVQIAAICDVYEPNLEAGLTEAGGQAKLYRNYKQLLDDKSIDVVIIATPEHWHHRMLLDALAAGKDVYLEKPFCQFPAQGIEMIEAAHRSKNIVQVGMQRRSYELNRRASEIRASGVLGSIRMVRSYWLNSAIQPVKAVLKGPLDWEQWQGPAPHRPLDPVRFGDWRNYSDYSGGIMADQGAHVFDGIHFAMGAGYPLAVNASAGRIHKPGVDLPESVVVTVEYPEDFLAVFTINYAAMRYQTRNDQLNQFDGDRARMDLGRESLKVYNRGAEETAVISETGSFSRAAEAHVENFLECVRTRKQPNGTVDKAFQAALVTQLGNRSLREKRRIQWDRPTS